MHVLGLVTDLLWKARLLSAASGAGGSVALASSAADAESKAAQAPPDLVVADLGVPWAWEAIPRVRKLSPGARVVGLYSHVDEETRARALAAGVEPMTQGAFVQRLADLVR